ncbi:MAG TPA: glycosyltransferase [Bryobacteraceae bacterium]|jgi:glycosyltransferase involved in cell wall biosynthesis|nr:glycosyltransferase [Bryobacteraceae bacterium]
MAAFEPRPELARCLDSLARQQSREALETIVADGTGEIARSMAAKYPAVRFLHFAQACGKPQLLSRAMEQACGSIVAVTEPYCCFPADWVEKLCCAHQSEFAVIGGAVEYDGAETLAGWACYLADYGAFMLPAERRVTALLAGNHISYKRILLAGASDLWSEGYFKIFLLRDLERRGCRFLFEPELVITYASAPKWREFARQYYRNGSEFAATRTRHFSRAARLAHIVTTPALPLLLLFRRMRAVWGKRRNRGQLVRSIPLLALFVLCWSAGEFRGYLWGAAYFTHSWRIAEKGRD